MSSSGYTQYSVFITPLLNSNDDSYGDEINVSDLVELDGVGDISQSIDAGDYDIGVFTFNELNLKGINKNGYFNDENDVRSIFPVGRDRAKVRVVFTKQMPTRNQLGTVTEDFTEETIQFQGIINDEATRLDIVSESISIKVLSRDSVIRTTKISGGVVSNGMSTTAAISAILNVPRITAVLSFDELNINPAIETTIDDGSKFDNRTVKDALDDLMRATSSVFIVDDDGNMIVRDRTENPSDVLMLYGKSDQYGRENIIDITAYNTGKQRMFNAVKVNDTEVSNNAFVTAYGFRKKSLTLNWITDEEKALAIATRILDEFKFPKIELNVKVATDVAKNVRLLDPVSINYPLRVKPPAGKFLPVVGNAVIGDAMTPLPYTFGSIEIRSRVSFKVVEKNENPGEFTSILKLRQTGKGYDDGYFDNPASCRIGFAVIGIAKICGEGDDCETFNPSVIAAAQIGCTVLA